MLSIASPIKTILLISAYSRCMQISMHTKRTLNPHFKKYKAPTQAMVKSLNLVLVSPIIPGAK